MTSEYDLLLNQVKQKLIDSGWQEDGILIEPSMSFFSSIEHPPDIVLLYELYPIAVVEVKPKNLDLNGLRQARSYAFAINLPIALVTNGEKTLAQVFMNDDIQEFENLPSPEKLWTLLGQGYFILTEVFIC